MIASNTQIPKFSPEIYGRIALNDLVTYAVYFLSQSGSEINAEDIVAACFKLFPERFQLCVEQYVVSIVFAVENIKANGFPFASV